MKVRLQDQLPAIVGEFPPDAFGGERVVITGMRRGTIGSATALLFSALGAEVAGIGESDESLRGVLEELAEFEFAFWKSIAADFSDPSQVTAAARFAEAAEPGALLNIAGVTPSTRVPFIEGSEEEERKLWAINYFSPVTITRPVMRGMCSRRAGRIVFLGSAQGDCPIEGMSTYAVTKRAIDGLVLALANEGAPDNVGVFSLHPGVVDVDRHTEEYLVEMARVSRTRRIITRLEVAAQIARLCLPSSIHQTGSVIDLTAPLIRMRE